MQVQKKKNGDIEVLRFLFAMIIVSFHFNFLFPFKAFSWGRIGVEYFFLITGFLLAIQTKKETVQLSQIPAVTWNYLKEKISRFLAYYGMALFLHNVVGNLLLFHKSKGELLRDFISVIPRFLFVDCLGFRVVNSSVTLGVDWYLSAMITAMAFLVPLLFLWYDLMEKRIFPILGILGYGYTYLRYGTLCVTTTDAYRFLDPLLVRAVANIAFGVALYEVAVVLSGKMKVSGKETGARKQALAEKMNPTGGSLFLTLLKWGCFLGTFAYAYFDFDKKYTVIPVLLLWIGITLCFSRCTFEIPDSPKVRMLGKLSLPLYLSHVLIRNLVIVYRGIEPNTGFGVLCILACPAFAYFFMLITDWIMRKL